jgi:polysaccharide biosynthesis/export protein
MKDFQAKTIGRFLAIGVLLIFFNSCDTASRLEDLKQYQNPPNSVIIKALDPTIRSNDLLYITVAPINDVSERTLQLLQIFNPSNLSMDKSSGGVSGPVGQLVDPEGNINMPGVGAIKVAGVTKSAAVQLIKKRISEYVRIETMVTIRITNFRVTVEGEVTKAGGIDVPSEMISLPQALALAGGMTLGADKANVQIFRTNDTSLHVERINLNSSEIFTTKSEYYYLRQNDHIYVEVNKDRALSTNQTTQRNVGYASSAVGILLALLTLIITSRR